jgi:DNA repair exonuclease SbcCD ATPase subunit
MQLPAQHRRDVIEDLLDIGIFSKMNIILKEKNSNLKDKIRDIEYQIEVLKNKIETQKKYITDINRINKDLREQKESSIKSLRGESEQLSGKNDELIIKISHNNAVWPLTLEKLQKKQSLLFQYQTQFNTDIKTVVKDAKFFEDNDDCPTCTQKIDDTVRQSKLDYAKNRAKDLQDGLSKLNTEIENISSE